MSEPFEIHQKLAPASASRARGKSRVELIVLHSDPDPADRTLASYSARRAPSAPHYYIDAAGTIAQLVPEERAARHSGTARWRQRRRRIDPISVGITLEHSPGAVYPPAQLVALNRLVQRIQRRHKLDASALVRWESNVQGQELGEGTLIPVDLPPIPVLVAPPVAAPGVLGEEAAEDQEVICIPPPLPPDDVPPLVLGEEGAVLGVEDNPQTAQRFWQFLIQETYRQRGEGFRADWSFHTRASHDNLGAPLARSAPAADQVKLANKSYGFQVFAGDTLFNEIPKWAEVQSLNAALGGAIPPAGSLPRLLLEASYRATGNAFHDNWSFHSLAVRERLGPALSGSYRITVGGQVYSIQVFARDTLYTPLAVPEANTNWNDVRRLSQLTGGDLYNALWVETYKPCAGAYDPNSAFQQLAAREKLGAPLTGLYQVEFEGGRFNVQVFAVDTLYSPAADPHRLSALARPPTIEQLAVTPPQGGTPPDPRDPNRRPVFTMLPLPTNTQPRIMQFYGYTHFSKENAARLYSQTQGCHSGLDFSATIGTPLLALDHGVIFCAGPAGKGQACPFGGAPPLVVIVQYGNVYAIYGHASAVHVQKGQVVRPGDILGLSGEYPANTPHLHFEIRPVSNPGTAFNPIEFFSPELRSSYYEPQLVLRGGLQHFCCGTLADQPVIQFGQPILTRSCEH